MTVRIKPFQHQHESSNYDLPRLEKKVNGIYNKHLKRIVGLNLALFIFLVLLPFFIIVSIAIIIDSGFPIFYKGERGGLNGHTFKIYKFRTMVKDADKIGGGTTALNDRRITKVGKILRKTKLDEFPQIINILKGEMSFIGPRPELIKYTSQYVGAEDYILKVRPGITDISSIEFINLDEVVGAQNADEMYEKLVLKRKNHLRIKYVEKISLILDIKLFYLTVIRTAKKILKFILKTEVKGGKGAA
jgi:lipopolysaccharide/colanic/teichoic acid biosynthesis glycosyltransferase